MPALLDAPSRPLVTLTRRELEVLALMARGLANHAIARELWLSVRTVETHIARIIAKLQLHADDDGHSRVLAVLSYLDSTSGFSPSVDSASARTLR